MSIGNDKPVTAYSRLRAAEIRGVLTLHGLEHWVELAENALEERMSPAGHGDFARWASALEKLASAKGDEKTIRDALMELSPWRKGPFRVGPVEIDAEWRSDQKWTRIRDAVGSLDGQRVLDVGCGNGYYALRMLDAGATSVIGIDPTVLFLLQFDAVTLKNDEYPTGALLLPLRLEEVPLPARVFDTTFSMGVLYHRRSPIDHLRELRQTLKPGGRLVLETLFLPGEDAFAHTPESRYARMRNVWLLPTIPELETWLRRTGYTDIVVTDRSVTSTDEQRQTDWMRFESLADALDPDDPALTLEGLPRPHRVVITATAR